MRPAKALCTAVVATLLAGSAACGRATNERPEPGVFVFGQLARPGDASSFRADARWARVTEGTGARDRVHLVVVPREMPPGSVRVAAEVHAGETEGSLFVIDAMRTVAAHDVASFRVGCVLHDDAAC